MILESLFGLAGFFQILAQAALFFFRPKKGEGVCPRLSIVICGRNAELDWKQNLPSWLECKSSNPVEFILVDDGSTDASLSLLNGFAERDERIRVVRIVSKQSPGKRDALLLGLSHASHAQVFVTDADCKPDSPHFIQELMHILGHEPSLFVGNGVLKPGHRFASVLATSDADRLARMNFSALPFLGFTTAVGRNMAYPREIGLSALRYSRKFGTAGGDDDLALPFLLSRCRNKRYAIGPYTLSDAPKSMQDWGQQKQRHYTTAPHYPLPIQLLFSLRWALIAINTIGLFALPFIPSSFVVGLVLSGWFVQLGAALSWAFRFRFSRQMTLVGMGIYLLAEILAIFVPFLILIQKSSPKNKTWNSVS